MRIALYQGEPVSNGFAEAQRRLVDICTAAAGHAAHLLVLPEMFLTGYNIGAAAVRAAAEPLDGAMLSRLSAIAMRNEIGILAGFPERAADGRIYNSAALIDAQGALRTVVRKTHLYGSVDRAQFSAGSALCPVFEFNGWRLGLAICYDIEFPELARAHALSGAQVILTPTANMEPYRSVATRIVPARAEENAVFVAYANYVGIEGAFSYCGLSCVVGPDGEDLARAGTQAEMIIADLSKTHLADVRARSSYLQDLRPELYLDP
ncbi:MAG: putative amidohydrolase [Gammaproteobacteria bacterium]|jgi:predicted amidohydrolase